MTESMVSFALLYVAPNGTDYPRSEYRMVDPGRAIPAAATAVHGVDAGDVEGGIPHNDATWYLVQQLHLVAQHHIPLVVFNARYDLTLLYVHAQRLGLGWPQALAVIDPLTIDRGISRGRMVGRRLGQLCSTYGVVLDRAHSADADARAAVLLAFAMAERHPELDCTVDQLMQAQARANARWGASWRSYSRRRGRRQGWDSGWPILDRARR